ncbi:MAG TPA: DUF2312 domain-containing protein [Polyangiaceae bacterium]|nr:DUF2312 domain-containing protein [Polyangiaceae bacterium]
MTEGTVAAKQLRLFIERAERIHAEVKSANEDLAEVFKEAKSNGYCPKTMKAVMRLRRLETHVRQEEDALLETYKQALGLD